MSKALKLVVNVNNHQRSKYVAIYPGNSFKNLDNNLLQRSQMRIANLA